MAVRTYVVSSKFTHSSSSLGNPQVGHHKSASNNDCSIPSQYTQVILLPPAPVVFFGVLELEILHFLVSSVERTSNSTFPQSSICNTASYYSSPWVDAHIIKSDNAFPFITR